jgi:hypothetical protein
MRDNSNEKNNFSEEDVFVTRNEVVGTIVLDLPNDRSEVLERSFKNLNESFGGPNERLLANRPDPLFWLTAGPSRRGRQQRLS